MDPATGLLALGMWLFAPRPKLFQPKPDTRAVAAAPTDSFLGFLADTDQGGVIACSCRVAVCFSFSANAEGREAGAGNDALRQ